MGVLELGLFESGVFGETPEVLRRRSVEWGIIDLAEGGNGLEAECISHMNKIIPLPI